MFNLLYLNFYVIFMKLIQPKKCICKFFVNSFFSLHYKISYYIFAHLREINDFRRKIKWVKKKFYTRKRKN